MTAFRCFLWLHLKSFLPNVRCKHPPEHTICRVHSSVENGHYCSVGLFSTFDSCNKISVLWPSGVSYSTRRRRAVSRQIKWSWIKLVWKIPWTLGANSPVEVFTWLQTDVGGESIMAKAQVNRRVRIWILGATGSVSSWSSLCALCIGCQTASWAVWLRLVRRFLSSFQNLESIHLN